MTTTTNFVWDSISDCVLSELDGTNAVQAVYTSEPQPYGGVLSQRRGTTTSTYHADALGTTRALTDSTQTTTDTYLYDAWGNHVASTGSTTNPFRWVGRYGYYQDASTGLVYVRARMYQPTAARWTSVVRQRSSSSEWKSDGIWKSANGTIPLQFLMKYALMSNSPSNGQDEERNPDNIPTKGGWFSLKSSDCGGSKYTNCCCSTFQVTFRPDDDQIAKYFFIELRVGQRSQRTFRGICPSSDTGWVVDDPENKEKGRSDWDYRIPTLPATWDDWPGDGPDRGPVLCCRNLCSLKTLKQEFEVCAIGTRKGAGAIRDPLGCIRYAHYCSTTITNDDPNLGAPHLWCVFDCIVHRTGSRSKVTPDGQVHHDGGLNELPFEIP